MHRRSILAKTGAKDQADLVKLVARLSNPAAY
jgi:DNA-binding CsgD family transcriptional regulator